MVEMPEDAGLPAAAISGRRRPPVSRRDEKIEWLRTSTVVARISFAASLLVEIASAFLRIRRAIGFMRGSFAAAFRKHAPIHQPPAN